MTDKEKQLLTDKYDTGFTSLLCYFLEDTYYEDKKDLDTIQRYIEETSTKCLQDTISQGREILQMQIFPEEWLEETCGYKLLSHIAGDDKKEKYYNWVKWIINTLETEARNAGKL